MNKVMKAVAALMLMMAVICTAGCNKKPENPDDPEQTVTLTGLWYANDQWFENEHDREAMDFINSNTVIWYGTVSTNKNAFQNMEGTSLDGCEGWYYFSKTYYTYVLTDNKIIFNDRIFTVFDGYLVEDGSSSQWKPWDDGNGGNGGGNTPATVTVTTYNPSDITSTGATCCADVTANNGSNIRELGVCWGTSAYPTVENSHLSTTTWNTPFVCKISDLVPETKYHVRSYALNGTSYVYGDDKSFTTLAPGGGGGQTYTITVAANPSTGGVVSGGGTYQQGQTCTVNAVANAGFEFVNWTENGMLCSTEVSYTFIVNDERHLVANFTEQYQIPEGAINGRFTINASGDQVYFSQGNLLYGGLSSKWCFATNQYDYIGEDNSNIPSYFDLIDLFGWGTSGWNSGNTYFRPRDYEGSDGSLYGPLGKYNLTGTNSHSDWGVHNVISNGGNAADLWRTLTYAEWTYVFNTRNTSSRLRYAKAQVAGVNGVILLPDTWNSSIYTINNANQNEASYNSNVITSSVWENTLQANGVVFLPAGGERRGTTVEEVGSTGFYWSASHASSNYHALAVYFTDYQFSTDMAVPRFCGVSVRLVCPAE